MQDVGFVIVGAGNIARTHADAMVEAQGARLVAIVSRTQEKAQALAARYPGVQACDNLEAALANPDIQAVTIATPSGQHLEIAQTAARHGKHVLCEKPLEVTLERADALIETCRTHGVLLAGIFQARLNDQVRLIREQLAQGRFGKLILASMQQRWFRDQAYYDSSPWRGTWALDGGGALMNQAIHGVDLLLHLAGDPVSVSADMDTMTHRNIEVEDTAVAILRFANGALGTLEASTSCAPGFARRLELSGEKGSVVLEDGHITRWQFVDEQPGDQAICDACDQEDRFGGGSSDPTAISHEGHRRLVEDLVQAIVHGHNPAIAGLEARRAVAVIRAMYASVQSGRSVPLTALQA